MPSVFRYGERFDWLSFHYEGFWCSSLAVSFTWPLLNEVLCLDVIECRILARSFWNPTLALSVTYLTMWPWAKLLPSLTCVCWGKGCGSCLVGWRQGSDGSGALSPICRYSVTVHCFCISTFRQAHKVILWLTVICLVLCCLFFFSCMFLDESEIYILIWPAELGSLGKFVDAFVYRLV